MWSEHCSYKSSRVHLKKLPTEAPWVICGPGENAGVIDIGDGDAAIFKMESHNHPSYIEPYQGAATGVGGILRDVFTMGARPIANLNALRFGRPDHPKMRHLIAGVVHGIGGYGNCVGVPTVGGEVNFDSAYDGNILVNAMTVGVAKTDKIFYSAATGIGNPIVYVGSKTGRDGIHGATMASADFDENSDEKRPTVQVGDPFTEKLLIEACLELMATDAIVAIQDMGAAGLTSSSVEMASKGGAGIRLDMNNVPCREEGMTPYEMMLSESQERMLMVLKPGREGEAEAIFHKWELDFAVIGEVTDTGHMVLEWNGEVVCDIPLGPLADEAPCYERPYISQDEYKAWARHQAARRRAGKHRHRGGPAEADGLAQPRQPPLDLGAVRQPGRRRHGPAPGRRRRGRARPRDEEGAGDHHRLHAALLSMPTRSRAASRRSPKPTATSARSARSRWRSPTASTSATRSGPRSWPRSSAALEGMGEACRALDYPDRERQRLASTTRARRRAAAARSCRRRRSAASGCWRIGRGAATIAFKAEGDHVVARRVRSATAISANRSGCAKCTAASGPPPPVDLGPSGASASSSAG